MAYQKLQPGRSRAYSPQTFSDTVDNVALYNNPILGLTSPSGTPGVLTSSSATTFIQDKVQPGDLVLNATVSSRGQSTLVKQVISDTELILQDADAIFFPSNFFYITPPPSEPAVLNVQQTTAGGISLKITTSGGDDLTFVGLQSGSYLPVQTTRIWETVGDNIIENGSFRSGSNLIQNGSFNEIGPELVTNGDFSAEGINLVDNPNFTDGVELLTQPIDLTVDFIANSGGVIDDSNSFTTAGGSVDGIVNKVTEWILVEGNSYKLVIEGSTTSSGFTIGNYLNGDEYGTGFGTHYFVAEGGVYATRLWIRQQTAGTTDLTTFTIEELGADWNLDYGTSADTWSFSDGTAKATNSVSYDRIQQNTSLSSGSYKVTVDISTYTNGRIVPIIAGQLGTSFPESSGIYTQYVTGAGSSSGVRIASNPDFNGSLNSVSVQELGEGWTLGAGWSIGDSVASCDGTASSSLYQNVSGVENKTYKITGTVSNYTSGTLQVGGSSSALDVDEDGAFVHYRVWTSDPNLYLKSKPGDGFNGSITNISVKEVAPYWTVTNSDSTHYVNFPTGYAQLIAATDSPQVQLEQNVLDATGLKSYEINCNIDYGQGSNLILNGDFSATGADLVLDGNFPLPNVNWIIAASTTINGGSATFGGLGAVTEAEMLLASFVVRVEADGGVVEAQTCLASDLTFLTENP